MLESTFYLLGKLPICNTNRLVTGKILNKIGSTQTPKRKRGKDDK